MSSGELNSESDLRVEIKNLNDHDLYEQLKALGASIGPVTKFTRVVYEKKLLKLIGKAGGDYSLNDSNQNADNSSFEDRSNEEADARRKEEELSRQQLQEIQLREKQIQQKLRDEKLREEHLREQQLREQQLREQQLREQQLLDQQRQQQEVMEQQLQQKQLLEIQQRKLDLQQQKLRLKELDQQQREQKEKDELRMKQLETEKVYPRHEETLSSSRQSVWGYEERKSSNALNNNGISGRIGIRENRGITEDFLDNRRQILEDDRNMSFTTPSRNNQFNTFGQLPDSNIATKKRQFGAKKDLSCNSDSSFIPNLKRRSLRMDENVFPKTNLSATSKPSINFSDVTDTSRASSNWLLYLIPVILFIFLIIYFLIEPAAVPVIDTD